MSAGTQLVSPGGAFLIVGAACSALAALLHLGCIWFGAAWYRFFGAGEGMVRLAQRGDPRATATTLAITALLLVWALYALSGASVIAHLPLLRAALCVISTIYLLRGLAGLLLIAHPLGRSRGFWLWSSLVCLGIGLAYALGTWQGWALL